jgi:carboxymethylenebutenolidase
MHSKMLREISKKVDVDHRGMFRRRNLRKPFALAACVFAIGVFLGSAAIAFARPPQDANVLVHDNQGLTDGVRDLARQFAAAGFLTLAPDLASRVGGSKNPQQTQGALNQMQSSTQIEDLSAGFIYLRKNPDVDAGKISSVGFGWGGWRTLKLASAVPDVYRAVVYCGATPNEGLETIKAPVMANYAQYDFRVTGGAIPTEKSLKAMGKKFTYYVYPNTDRAFFNPANPRYDADAAKQAWGRTVDFLRASM